LFRNLITRKFRLLKFSPSPIDEEKPSPIDEEKPSPIDEEKPSPIDEEKPEENFI
jgi:hypothetical protein